MRGALILLVLSITAGLGAPAVADPAPGHAAYVMPDAEQWTMTSRTGRRYQISLARPAEPPPPQGYPVIYVLDGNWAFATMVEAARMQEGMLGKAVVVGIGYVDNPGLARMSDMTMPVDAKALPAGAGSLALGGAGAFLDFIQDELKPAVDKVVHVDAARETLSGHSLGGLFVLHALFSRPDSFDAYVAASPSIWWGDKAVLAEVAAFEAQQARTRTPRRLLITVGGLEGRLSPEEEAVVAKAAVSMPMDTIRRMFEEQSMIGNAHALAERLRPLEAQGLTLGYVTFEGETHNAVMTAAQSRGARFALLPAEVLADARGRAR